MTNVYPFNMVNNPISELRYAEDTIPHSSEKGELCHQHILSIGR